MLKYVVWACCALSIAAGAAAQTSAKTYELKATPTTTFYRFLDAATPPVLTINSGDSVKLETATGTPGYFERLGVPKDKIPAELYETFKGVDDNARRDHTLTGPIFVTGAERRAIRSRSGCARSSCGCRSAASRIGPNGGTLPGEFARSATRLLYLDLKNRTAEYVPGVVVPLKQPFWGSIAVVPPPSVGRVTDQQPNIWGANMDNSRSDRGDDALPARLRAGSAAVDRRRARRARTGRGWRIGDRDVTQGRDSGHRAQGQDARACPARKRPPST